MMDLCCQAIIDNSLSTEHTLSLASLDPSCFAKFREDPGLLKDQNRA